MDYFQNRAILEYLFDEVECLVLLILKNGSVIIVLN
mgnify:CR=1 FL=1